MQSPKFPFKTPRLKEIVSATRLEDLWKASVRDWLRKQVLPDAVEFLDFHVQLKQRCNELEASICNGGYVPSPSVRLKSEKSRGLCRQMVLPSPEDALVLQALSDSLWQRIKKKAPSKNSFYAPQDQPFKIQNLEPGQDEWGYGPIEAWLDFQKSILGFSETYKFVVVTDIANYYDSILHSFLRSILSDYGLEKEHALDLLLFVLDSMLWRPDYMPNYGIGLPQMNLDAPRLLAHTHLFEIDEIFSKRKDIGFARYMDDIDFGVDTVALAKAALRDLDLALQTRNLRLNSGKTKILTAQQARIHFRIDDNILIDRLISRIDKKFFLDRYHRVYSRLLRRILDSGLASGTRFEGGNGDKIIKRILGQCLRLKCGISDDAFRAILYDKPGLRDVLLRCWAASDSVTSQLKIVSGFLHSGQAVDDLAKVAIVTSFVSACHKKPVSKKDLSFLFDSLDSASPFDIFCRLWLKSRFGSRAKLKEEIVETRHVWSRYRFLIRTVAGFYGVFYGSSYLPNFEKYVKKWGGPDAISILNFHEDLVKNSVFPVLGFLKAPNKSLSVQISHPKYLILISAIRSASLTKPIKAKLLGIHNVAMSDYYYQRKLSRAISSVP